MIDGLKPYPEYKESGLPWVGKLPVHWSLLPNGALVQRRKVLVGNRHQEFRLLSLTKQGVIVRDVSTGKGKFSSDMGTSQEVRNGDLVFCMFDVPETPRTVGLSRHAGMITGAYTVFAYLSRGNVKYFELFYRAMDDRKLLSPLYSGLRNTIPAERFRGTKTPQPPLDEQAAIVRFLDHANAKIEHAIKAKRKLIALLVEQKQAVVHRAITRGLDHTARLKPSGFPWLGEIPQHWEVRRVKYLLRPVDRRSATGAEVLLTMRKHHGLVPFAEHFTRPAQAATLKGFKIVEPGQIVVNRMQAGFGLIFASSLSGLVSPDYSVLESIGDATCEYLGELFRTTNVRAQFQRESKGLGTGQSGFMRLYDDRLAIIHVAYPPPQEQSAILAYLATAVQKENAAIERAEREIALLREYRTTLTADVVTGKLDTRDAAKELPTTTKPIPAEDGADAPDDTEDELTEFAP